MAFSEGAVAGQAAERFFLAAGALFGLAYLAALPPFQAPDEWRHFYRGYQVSELVLGFEPAPGGSASGSDGNGVSLPAEVFDLGEEAGALGLMLSPGHKIGLADIAWMARPREARGRRWRSYREATGIPCVDPPSSYLPQALAIALGRALGRGPLALFYLARLGNLLAWLLLTWLALRSAPALKDALAAAALLPMSLQQAASCSHDGLINGLAMLWTGLALRLNREGGPGEALTRPRLAALAACLAVLCAARPSHLALLILLVPAAVRSYEAGRPGATGFGAGGPRLGAREPRLGAALLGLGGIGAAAAAAWSFVARDAVARNFALLGGSAGVAGRLGFLLAHPLDFLSAALPMLFSTATLASGVGVLGWMDAPLPLWAYGLAPAALAAAACSGPESPISPRQGRAALAAVLCGVLATLLLLAIQHSAPPRVSLRLQGRHLLPWLPALLALLAACSRALPSSAGPALRSPWRLRAALCAACLVAGAGVRAMVERYYLGAPAPRSALAAAGLRARGPGGMVETVRAHGRYLTVTGWGAWKGSRPGQGLAFAAAPAPADEPRLSSVRRPDLARLLGPEFLDSGFRLILTLPAEPSRAPRRGSRAPRLCLLSLDPELGVRALEGSDPGVGPCAGPAGR